MTRARSTAVRLAAAAVAFVATLTCQYQPASANASGTNYIQNAGSVGGLGVIHNFTDTGDQYELGVFDAVLPQGKFSSSAFGWSHTEGYYLGSGYCAQIWRRYNASDAWSRYSGDVLGPHQAEVSRYYYWKLVPYHAASASSCV
jgi:hypothetical protein